MISEEYKFPEITNRMFNILRQWVDDNGLDKTNSCIGGNIRFIITPTSVGDIVKAAADVPVHDELGNVSYNKQGVMRLKEISVVLSNI